MTLPTRFLPALFALLLLAACGGEKSEGTTAAGTPDEPGAEAHDHDHDHEEGPHGGAVVILGDHELHLEVLHHMDEQAVEIYAYDADMNPVDLDQAPKLNLAGAAGKVGLTAESMDDGGWRFVHESLAEEPGRARFQVQVAGKTYVPEMPEEHDHGDHEEHAHD